MTFAGAVVALFGLFCVVGGLIGYLKAKSVPSLVTGSLSGLVLLTCAYGMRQGVRLAGGLSAAVALLLGARFAGTWRRHHRVMPDLLMILFSLATLIAVAPTLLKP